MFNFILLLYECSLTRNVSASEQQHLLSKLQAIYQNFSATPIKETEGLVNMITNMALQRILHKRQQLQTLFCLLKLNMQMLNMCDLMVLARCIRHG